MNLFWENKLLTTLVLLFLYGGSWLLFGHEATSFWVACLFIYMVTGYGHFLLGFVYQTKSIFEKTTEPWRNLAKIWSLSLLLTIPFLWALLQPQIGLYVILFVVIYFLWHGACNEKTLYERHTGAFNNLFYLVGGLMMVLFVDSFRHPSIFFDNDYVFDAQLDATFINRFWEQLYLLEIFWMTLLIVGGWSLYLLARAVKKKKWHNGLIVLAGGGLTGALWLFSNPPSFIFLLSIILTYHFVMWWLYYAQVFLKKLDKKPARNYFVSSLILHLLLILMVGIGYYQWFDWPVFPELYAGLFMIQSFLVVTFVHITTSFFNEDPVKRWLRIK